MTSAHPETDIATTLNIRAVRIIVVSSINMAVARQIHIKSRVVLPSLILQIANTNSKNAELNAARRCMFPSENLILTKSRHRPRNSRALLFKTPNELCNGASDSKKPGSQEAKSIRHFRVGSDSTDSRCPRHVRFAPSIRHSFDGLGR